MNKWNSLATEEVIQKTIEALWINGIRAIVVDTMEDAKKFVDHAIPQEAEVMTMTSVSLDSSGIAELINSSRPHAVRPRLMTMDKNKDGREMNKLGSAPEWAIGSVHAVTQDGKVVVASNTGSQIPAYAYGSQHVIWVVGTQKIVSNLEQAFDRIYEYVLPLESERAKKAYGAEGSNVSKALVVHKEVISQRIQIVFVKEVLGF